MNPTRDLDIISQELRVKDIEFTQKALENLKKQTRRGGQTLEMKRLKEEEATVEKVLALLEEGKDVRKGEWTPKEVSEQAFRSSFSPTMMTNGHETRNLTQLVEAQKVHHEIRNMF